MAGGERAIESKYKSGSGHLIQPWALWPSFIHLRLEVGLRMRLQDSLAIKNMSSSLGKPGLNVDFVFPSNPGKVTWVP